MDPHDLTEREGACADGMCPLCLRDQLAGADAELQRYRQENVWPQELEHSKVLLELRDARAVLREVEWVNFPNEDWLMVDLCPLCGDGDAHEETGRKETGHAPDCRLAKVIAP